MGLYDGMDAISILSLRLGRIGVHRWRVRWLWIWRRIFLDSRDSPYLVPRFRLVRHMMIPPSLGCVVT